MEKRETKSPTPEERLVAAGEELGRILGSLPEEKKAVVRAIQDGVNREFEEQKKQGAYLDRSAFFAAALIGHPDLEDEHLSRAASNYVDADLAYIRWLKEQEEPAGGE